MEFSAIVRQIRQLHAQQEQHQQKKENNQTLQCSHLATVLPPEVGVVQDFDGIYGRVCTTSDINRPVLLSSDLERKTVFVFGPDAIQSVLLKLPIHEVLYSLGYDKQYLYDKVQKNDHAVYSAFENVSAITRFCRLSRSKFSG